MASDDHSYHLEDLERRWHSERTPQLTLQLAEEYRGLARFDRAIEVVREGLDRHPNHLSSKVALGRYLLDGGDATAAAGVLREIIGVDPTHLVANKLLVRSYIELGDADEAQEYLERYTVLNEGDADIEDFRARLGLALEAAPAPASEDIGGSVEDLAGPPEVPGPPAPRTNWESRSEFESEPESGFESDPPTEPASEPVAQEADAGVETVAEPEPEENDLFAPVGFAAPTASAAVATASGIAALSGGASDGPFGNVWGDLPAADYWSELSSEGLFAVEAPSSAAESVAATVVGEVPAAVESVAAEPTATLGRLYLEQGHRSEAAQIFESVLEREPGNEAALAGMTAARVTDGGLDGVEQGAAALAGVTANGSGELRAADLMPADRGSDSPPDERRAVMLRNYLLRIKGAAPSEFERS